MLLIILIAEFLY
ncbi:hypothetical protein CGLO_15892 [Colletotrichum gloeosporioides Cg-14]|uniref:Uncharacterized protein n=1 Tax=Colletotrichum gloeosporioides (strain Cg-14) TaxID=1237896 RepID=T0K0K6_COLGC|nr:hypothetical protein CGLO_15892 [Colletotrichum gloeosporioides Cg-14]